MDDEVGYESEVLVCDAQYFKDHSSRLETLLEDCLVFVTQPVTYDSRVALCTVYFIRQGDIHLISPRAKLVTPDTLVITESPIDRASLAPIAAHRDGFFTSLCERDAYRKLSYFTQSRLSGFLLEAHDIAALHAYKSGSALYKRFRAEPTYGLLVSDDETLYSYLSLHQLEDVNLARTRKILSIQTELALAKNIKLPMCFDFESPSVLKSPINVIIGANGVGKTRLLKALVKAARHNELDIYNDFDDDHGSDHIPVVVFTHEKQQWTTFSRETRRCVSLGVSTNDWKSLTRVLQELFLKDDTGYHINMAVKLLETVIDIGKLSVKLRSAQDEYVPLVGLMAHINRFSEIDTAHALVYRDRAGIDHPLSSGQRALVGFILNIVRYCTDRTLVLVDEPENHLHPQFISQMMQALNTSLLATESVAIVVTHSPFVVREVDKSGVMILEQHGELPVILRPTLQTLGGDVSLISDFVFGDLDIRKGYQQAIDEAMGQGQTEQERRDAVQSIYGLGSDAATYLRTTFER